jgi:hypothetical protein
VTVCPKCQAENVEGAQFCERCGHALTRRPRWVLPAIVGGVVVALAGAVVAVAVVILGGNGSEDVAARRSSPTPTPSQSPTQTGPVEAEASFPRYVPGTRINFWLNPGPSRDPECVVNLFRYQGLGKGRGAFKSECSDWDSPGYDIYFFSVMVHNTSKGPFTLRRDRFTLVDRKEKEHHPVNLKERALFPRFFLGRQEKLRTDEEVQLWVTFKADPQFVPKELRYRDGEETLIILFEGKMLSNPPS